jgi:hypothetical protein
VKKGIINKIITLKQMADHNNLVNSGRITKKSSEEQPPKQTDVAKYIENLKKQLKIATATMMEITKNRDSGTVTFSITIEKEQFQSMISDEEETNEDNEPKEQESAGEDPGPLVSESTKNDDVEMQKKSELQS